MHLHFHFYQLITAYRKYKHFYKTFILAYLLNFQNSLSYSSYKYVNSLALEINNNRVNNK